MKVTREQAISEIQSRMDKRRSSITEIERDIKYIRYLIRENSYFEYTDMYIQNLKRILRTEQGYLKTIVKEQHIDKFLMKYLLEDIAMERAYSCHASNTWLYQGFLVNEDGNVEHAYNKPQKIIKGPV